MTVTKLGTTAMSSPVHLKIGSLAEHGPEPGVMHLEWLQ